MRITILLLVVAALVILGSFCCGAQSHKAEDCSDSCCQEAGKAITTKTVSMTTRKELTCRLTTPELRKRKEEVIASLKSKTLSRQELSEGYKFRFAATDAMIDEVMTFVKTERVCCDFFVFEVSVVENTLWLSITGPEGAKEFVVSEMGL